MATLTSCCFYTLQEGEQVLIPLRCHPEDNEKQHVHPFIFQFIRYFISSYYVPLAFLEAGDLVMNKTDKNLSAHGVDIPEHGEENSIQGIPLVPSKTIQ